VEQRRIFISHTSYDAPVARYLRDVLNDAFGVRSFMMPDDAEPGLPWLEQIRSAVHECDEIVSLVTPESAKRPWLAAEWACFWLSERRTTPLLAEIKVPDIWEPMRAANVIDLLDSGSVGRWLADLATRSPRSPVEGVRGTAAEVGREVARIRKHQRYADLETALAQLTSRIRSGADNVREEDVAAAVQADRIPDILAIATHDDAAPVKQRQVAVALLRLGRAGEAGELAVAIANRAEMRNVGYEALRRMPRGASEDSEEWLLLAKIFPLLGPPQVRDLRTKMAQLGIVPIGPFAAGGP
jgi:hypothetical protein